MDLRPLADSVAKVVGTDARFLRAIVLVESNWNPWAWNPEPRYRYLWNVRTQQPFRALTHAQIASEDPPIDFPTMAGDRDQEWWGQQASWGLCQVMGAVAREHGFTRPYLPELCDPESNLMIGAKVLRALVAWSKGDLSQAAAAYNAGVGNWQSGWGRNYSGKIMGAYAVLRTG